MVTYFHTIGCVVLLSACGPDLGHNTDYKGPRSPKYGIAVYPPSSGFQVDPVSIDAAIDRTRAALAALGSMGRDSETAAWFCCLSVHFLDPDSSGAIRCPYDGARVGGCYTPDAEMYLPTPPAFYDRSQHTVPECDGADMDEISHELAHRFQHVLYGDLDPDHNRPEWFWPVGDNLLKQQQDACFATLRALRIKRT
jgi:hypothetical protein